MGRTRAGLLLAAAITGAAAGALVLTSGGDTGPASGPRPSSGTHEDLVWDGDVRFQFRTIDCGTGPSGDSDTAGIRPEGMHCWTHFTVLNDSREEVVLPWAAQRLVTDAGSLPPSGRAMHAILLDEPGHLFDTSIPPGGGGSGTIVFDVPLGADKSAVRLHAAEGSSGATIRLDACRFLGPRGGGCYAEDAPGAEQDVAYPFTISGPRGGMALLAVCFDYRQWEVVEPHPTEGMPETFTGHGVMTLTSPERAEFRDNSGKLLTLAPTAQNQDQPGVCGGGPREKG